MNAVWHGGCGMSMANDRHPCGPAAQMLGAAFVSCWNFRMPWAPWSLNSFMQSSAVALSPPLSQKIRFTPAALGLRPDALGDHVHDRDRLQVRQVADGDALTAAGLGRGGFGHVGWPVSTAAEESQAGSVVSASRLRCWLAPSILLVPTRRRSATLTTSIVGITTNSADNLRLIMHFPLT